MNGIYITMYSISMTIVSIIIRIIIMAIWYVYIHMVKGSKLYSCNLYYVFMLYI